MKHYKRTILTAVCCFAWYIIYFLSSAPLPNPILIINFLWLGILINVLKRDEIAESKSRIFKYKIGETTDRGKIKSRYYLEWKNRNGGNMLGYYYVMENGDSLNEILINEGVTKAEMPVSDKLIIGLDKPSKDQELIDFYHEQYNELVKVARKANCQFPITKVDAQLIENIFGVDDVVFAYSDSRLLQTDFPILEFEPLTSGKFILCFESGNLVVVSGYNLSMQKMGFIAP